MLEKLLRWLREPNPNVHRVLFFARLGGTGGFVVLSFGCAGLYGGISDGASGESGEYDDTLEGVYVCEMAVESMGKELQDSRGGESG